MRFLQRNKVIMASAVAAVLVAAPAKAGVFIIDFTEQDGGPSNYNLLATIDTANTLNASGGYNILSISGIVSALNPPAGPIDGLFGGQPGVATLSPASANTPAGQFIFDNTFYLTPPPLSNPGVLFTIGGFEWNLFSTASTGPNNFTLDGTNPGSYNPSVTGSLSVTTISGIPEASTWAMMLLGFLGLGFMAYRRKSNQSFRFA